MMQRPILSGRMGKWAYSLVEYELDYEPLKAVRGQIVPDFIADHSMSLEGNQLVEECPWRLLFNGWVCSRSCGVGYVTVSPSGVVQEVAMRLEFKCTNNQADYEALIICLRTLLGKKARNVEACGDSQLWYSRSWERASAWTTH
jgi:hypothetical protein